MSIDVTEQSILEALHNVPRERWTQVLELIHTLVRRDSRPSEEPEEKCWTAAELLALPLDERDVILAKQAARAEWFYRNEPELTAFEAFGEEDLYVENSDTPSR